MEDYMSLLSYLADKILLALLLGVVSSGIFFLVLKRLRPSVKVSPVIAKGQSLGKRTVYRVKIINKTRAPLIDIQAQLHVFEDYPSQGGAIWKTVPIQLQRASPISIGPYDKKDPDADYAYRFLTFEDLDSVWSDDSKQFLRFRLLCRSAFSGISGFFQQDYKLPKRTSLVEGDFSKGDTFEVTRVRAT